MNNDIMSDEEEVDDTEEMLHGDVADEQAIEEFPQLTMTEMELSNDPAVREANLLNLQVRCTSTRSQKPLRTATLLANSKGTNGCTTKTSSIPFRTCSFSRVSRVHGGRVQAPRSSAAPSLCR